MFLYLQNCEFEVLTNSKQFKTWQSVFRSSHILLDWAPAPERGRIETQAISSLTGSRPPIRGCIEAQTISSLTGPRPPKGSVSELKPYLLLLGPGPDNGVSALRHYNIDGFMIRNHFGSSFAARRVVGLRVSWYVHGFLLWLLENSHVMSSSL
jgi:hypothetical protein